MAESGIVLFSIPSGKAQTVSGISTYVCNKKATEGRISRLCHSEVFFCKSFNRFDELHDVLEVNFLMKKIHVSDETSSIVS